MLSRLCFSYVELSKPVCHSSQSVITTTGIFSLTSNHYILNYNQYRFNIN